MKFFSITFHGTIQVKAKDEDQAIERFSAVLNKLGTNDTDMTNVEEIDY